jgi:hypothetical protein
MTEETNKVALIIDTVPTSWTATDSYSGKSLYLGKFKVLRVAYNSGRQKGDDSKMYIVESYLPGVKEHQGYYPTQELAQKRAELVLNYWLEKALLTERYE